MRDLILVERGLPNSSLTAAGQLLTFLLQRATSLVVEVDQIFVARSPEQPGSLIDERLLPRPNREVTVTQCEVKRAIIETVGGESLKHLHLNSEVLVETDARAFAARSVDPSTDHQPREAEETEDRYRATTAREQQLTPVERIDLSEPLAIPNLSVHRAERAVHQTGCGEFMRGQARHSVEGQHREQVPWMESLTIEEQREKCRYE